MAFFIRSSLESMTILSTTSKYNRARDNDVACIPIDRMNFAAGPLNGPSPRKGDSATLTASVFPSALLIPGVFRMGMMLVTGFAGQNIILSACDIVRTASLVALALSIPLYPTSLTSSLPPSLTQNSWRWNSPAGVTTWVSTWSSVGGRSRGRIPNLSVSISVT